MAIGRERENGYVLLFMVLVLLAAVNDPGNNYRPMTSFLLTGFVVYLACRNLIYTIYITIAIVLLLHLCCGVSPLTGIERFENEMKANALMNKVEAGLVKTSPSGEDKKKIDAAIKDASEGVAGTDISAAIKAEVGGDDTYSEYTKQINTYDLAKAQKETFEMINSVKQLKDVMDSLAPTLKEGRKVLDMFSSLNIKPAGGAGKM